MTAAYCFQIVRMNQSRHVLSIRSKKNLSGLNYISTNKADYQNNMNVIGQVYLLLTGKTLPVFYSCAVKNEQLLYTYRTGQRREGFVIYLFSPSLLLLSCLQIPLQLLDLPNQSHHLDKRWCLFVWYCLSFQPF